MAYQRAKKTRYEGMDVEVEDSPCMRDYVKDNTVYAARRQVTVMVTCQGDLANLEGYLPGTIAYTAGFGSMWQLAANNTWVAVGGE